jgi:hypothetical protein
VKTIPRFSLAAVLAAGEAQQNISETMQKRTQQMKATNTSRGIGLKVGALLLVLAGALFLAGCETSDSGSNSGGSSPPSQHHH